MAQWIVQMVVYSARAAYPELKWASTDSTNPLGPTDGKQSLTANKPPRMADTQTALTQPGILVQKAPGDVKKVKKYLILLFKLT